MKFEQSDVHINFVDGIMSVDGDAYAVGSKALLYQLPPGAEGVRALRWSPKSGAKVPGYIESDNSHGFESFDCFKPFLPLWTRARDDAMAAKARLEAATKAREEKIAAEEAAAVKQQADYEEYIAAVTELGGTDHEVIKAMEQFLANEGRLPKDLVAKRAAARAKAKAEKKRLNIK